MKSKALAVQTVSAMTVNRAPGQPSFRPLGALERKLQAPRGFEIVLMMVFFIILPAVLGAQAE
jgi:hypothetical protein